MPCLKQVASISSSVQIPTVVNAVFSALLLGIFAYIHRNRDRAIRS